MAEDGADTPLPRVDGHLQVGVRIKKHALLQAGGTQVCNKASVRIRQLNISGRTLLKVYSHANSPVRLNIKVRV